jgi:hypothetical protein
VKLELLSQKFLKGRVEKIVLKGRGFTRAASGQPEIGL